MAGKVGHPKLGTPNLLSFRKLLEDPLSVNIPGGTNPLTVIKDEIRSNLIANSHMVKNEIIRSSIEYMSQEEDRLIEYMKSITKTKTVPATMICLPVARQPPIQCRPKL